MVNIYDSNYTRKLLGCAFEVHTALGPGLLESVYEEALSYELRQQGFSVEHQLPVNLKYKGQTLDTTLRLDLLVDNAVILELKSVGELQPLHFKQLQTYLNLTGIHLGYLINFNVVSLKDNIHRMVNNY